MPFDFVSSRCGESISDLSAYTPRQLQLEMIFVEIVVYLNTILSILFHLPAIRWVIYPPCPVGISHRNGMLSLETRVNLVFDLCEMDMSVQSGGVQHLPCYQHCMTPRLRTTRRYGGSASKDTGVRYRDFRVIRRTAAGCTSFAA